MNAPPDRPAVLCLSGHDPSGGAGIQADIEAIRAQGAHPATVITAMTVQDSRNAYAVDACDPQAIIEQAELILEDLPVSAIKLGLLGSGENAEAIARLLDKHPGIPVVLDPVLRAGGGAALADQALINAITHDLFSRAAIVTPNLAEARVLAGTRTGTPARPALTREDCAQAMLAQGAKCVLITGGDEMESSEVLNSLHGPAQSRHWRWPRLPHRYHGSGCTLAACLAARVSLGESLEEAAEAAQRYTWQCLNDAYRIGRGQFFPRR